MNRPTWDEYFLSLAFLVSSRSDDQFIKHGAVIVCNKSKHIIGTGYNNTPRGFDTSLIDLSDRDGRRPYMVHAEDNAITNMTKSVFDLQEGATIYITGQPCCQCIMKIVSAGITDITFADRIGSVSHDKEMYSNLVRNNGLRTILRVPMTNFVRDIGYLVNE